MTITIKQQLDFELFQNFDLSTIFTKFVALNKVYQLNKLKVLCNENIVKELNKTITLITAINNNDMSFLMNKNSNNEYKEITDLFTDINIAKLKLSDIKNGSDEFRTYPESERDKITKLKLKILEKIKTSYLIISDPYIKNNETNIDETDKEKYKNHFMELLERSSNQQKNIDLSKISTLSLTFVAIITAIIYFFSWHITTDTLERIGLSDYLNYIDVATLALKAKMNVILVLLLSVPIVIYCAVNIKAAYKEEYIINNKFFFLMNISIKVSCIILPYIIITFVTEVSDSYQLQPMILIFTIIAVIIMLIIEMKTNTITKDSLAYQLIAIFFITIFFFATVKIIEGNLVDKLFYFALFIMILLMITEFEIISDDKWPTSLLYIFFLGISAVPAINILKQKNILELTNFAKNPNLISIIQISTDNNMLEQELEHNGFIKLNVNESENIFLSSEKIISFTLNRTLFNEKNYAESKANICTKIHNRILLQETVRIEKNLETKTQPNYFMTEEYCRKYINDYYSIETLNLNKWAQKVFSVQKINGLYFYWIYGVHIPFFQQNKVLFITSNMINEFPLDRYSIKLNTENGLKSFNIVDSFNYYVDHEKSINHLIDLKQNLSIESQ
ncbi:MAG: hypothetical protein EKK54_04330 [Neisseriaceae bacterium]|nr:MAG: hypothetical protein EKK54_04330 [Neisseriaceae bacterium]